MKETDEYFNLINRVTKAVSQLPRRAAVLAVAFSKQRFRDQAWVDNSTEVWKKRAKGWKTESRKRQGRAILVDTGRLKRSIRTVSVDDSRAIIGTDVPYARAHNDGFRGQVTQQVRGFTRAGKRGSHHVRAHSRKRNVTLPRRRFLGTSAILDKQLTRMMTAEIIRAIKG